MGYVINLISGVGPTCLGKPGPFDTNDYGYWTGKSYRHDGNYFPYCTREITEDTKIYKSEKVANTSAQKLIDKYLYVVNAIVEPYNENPMSIEEAKKTIEALKPLQEAGELFPCPRCGHHRMDKKAVRNALSRHASVYICSQCGMDEAIRDMTSNVLPLNQWGMVI